MDSHFSKLEKYFGTHFHVVIGIAVLLLLLLIVASMVSFQSSSTEQETSSDEWSADQKKNALEELHEKARQQNVPQFSDEDKLRMLNAQ